MNTSAAFAVPKDRLTVTLRLSREILIEGEIFLESIAEGLSIHQKLTAFLENSSVFFPIKIIPEGVTEFISKRSVRTIEVNFPDEPEAGYFAHLHMHTIPVKVFFHDGDSTSGELMAEVPKEKARLSDCLNLPGRFIDVRTGKKMCYINKEALQKVVYTDKKT